MDRFGISESPAFEAMREKKEEARSPLLDVLRNHPRNLLLAVGAGLGAFVAQGTLTTFTIAYSLGAGFERGVVLNALTLPSVGAVVGILFRANLTDRVGRRPVVITAASATAGFAYLLFPMLDSGSTLMLVLVVVLGQSILHATYYGPLAALMSEIFSARSRYTGASLGYQLAGLGAGFAPLLFASLQKGGVGTGTLSTVIAGFCLLSGAASSPWARPTSATRWRPERSTSTRTSGPVSSTRCGPRSAVPPTRTGENRQDTSSRSVPPDDGATSRLPTSRSPACECRALAARPGISP